MCSSIIIMDPMIRKLEHRNRNPHHAVPTPGPQDNHPFLLIPPCRENGCLSRNVCSTGSGPNPQFHHA
jgi:hypothetical protein